MMQIKNIPGGVLLPGKEPLLRTIPSKNTKKNCGKSETEFIRENLN